MPCFQGRNICVLFSGVSRKIEAGNVTQGIVFSTSPGLGVKVQLPGGLMGRVALCDMCDEYVDCPTEKYSKGDCVQCYVLQSNEAEKSAVLSMRNSRLVEHSLSFVLFVSAFIAPIVTNFGEIVKFYSAYFAFYSAYFAELEAVAMR